MNFNNVLLLAMALLASQLVNDVSAQARRSDSWSIEIAPRATEQVAQADRPSILRLPNHKPDQRPNEAERNNGDDQTSGPRSRDEFNRDDFNRPDTNRTEFNRGPQFSNPPRQFAPGPERGFNGPQFNPRKSREFEQRSDDQRTQRSRDDRTESPDSDDDKARKTGDTKAKPDADKKKKRREQGGKKKPAESVSADSPKEVAAQLPEIVPQQVRIPSYVDVQNSIPFSRATYNADRTYRHNATMELLLGQLRPQTIYNSPPATTNAARPIQQGYGTQRGYSGRPGFNYFVIPGAPFAPPAPALQGRIGFGLP